MNELPFGSVSSMWPGGFAWFPTAAPINRSGGAGISSQPLAVPNIISAPVFSTPVFRPPQAVNPSAPEAYGPLAGALSLAQSTAPLGGLSFGVPIAPNPAAFLPPPSAVLSPGFATTIPTLLAAVAARRGHLTGPTSDSEIEDFIYDVFELFPGTADVEIRCEGARATLTGTVHQKRLKHDIGEIVWAIPAINDVQNNVAIITKRRTRRESEPQTAAASRKQA